MYAVTLFLVVSLVVLETSAFRVYDFFDDFEDKSDLKKDDVENIARRDQRNAPPGSYYMGCFRDNADNSTMRLIDGTVPTLMDDYRTRENAKQKCYDAAKAIRGVVYVFALQNGGQCYVADSWKGYRKYGELTFEDCGEDGEGGPLANAVYSTQ